MEDFIASRGLQIHNVQGEPATFHKVNGESSIDLTLSTRGATIQEWTVHPDASSSDHRLITYHYNHARQLAPNAEPSEEPKRYRERGVDWDRFE